MSKNPDPRLVSSLAVISGIPAGESGTGRLIAHLETGIAELLGGRVKLISRPQLPALWHILFLLRSKTLRQTVLEFVRQLIFVCKFWLSVGQVLLINRRKLVLLHPQSLGFPLALRLLETRREPAIFYLLDSSFFCVASYNKLPGENGACLRCLDLGFDQIVQNGRKPFPRLDPKAVHFARRLQKMVKEGRVKVVAQNLRQAELAQRHFALASLPSVVGLWTKDWDEILLDKAGLAGGETTPAEYSFDVLFHGHCLDAKGAVWTAELAAHCPELRFMFPFSKPDWLESRANCFFVPCTWETGLRDALVRSRYVIVPSLWSAPIEGALVKSIASARAVIVVDNPTSFSDELPNGLLVKLSGSLPDAAAELRHAIASDWRPDPAVKTLWLADFAKVHSVFLRRLLAETLHGVPKEST